jgi:hypothetical protein
VRHHADCSSFIVGQVTPDMIEGIRYGTFILFGVLISLGAAFIWFYVPETKRLTLEEMDTVFGSSGVAAADQERMAQINRELGIGHLHGDHSSDSDKAAEKVTNVDEAVPEKV